MTPFGEVLQVSVRYLQCEDAGLLVGELDR